MTESPGVRIDVDAQEPELPAGYEQFIEIVREIDSNQIKLQLIDEPTAVLADNWTELPLKLINTLKRLGACIIFISFISHRLGEIMVICDKIIVLGDSWLVAENFSRKVKPNQIKVRIQSIIVSTVWACYGKIICL